MWELHQQCGDSLEGGKGGADVMIKMVTCTECAPRCLHSQSGTSALRQRCNKQVLWERGESVCHS